MSVCKEKCQPNVKAMAECLKCEYALCTDCLPQKWDFKEEYCYVLSKNHEGHIMMRNSLLTEEDKCEKCGEKAIYSCTAKLYESNELCKFKLCEKHAVEKSSEEYDFLKQDDETKQWEVATEEREVPLFYWTFNRKHPTCPLISLHLNQHQCDGDKGCTKCTSIETLYYCPKHDFDLCKKCYNSGKD